MSVADAMIGSAQNRALAFHYVLTHFPSAPRRARSRRPRTLAQSRRRCTPQTDTVRGTTHDTMRRTDIKAAHPPSPAIVLLRGLLVGSRAGLACNGRQSLRCVQEHESKASHARTSVGPLEIAGVKVNCGHKVNLWCRCSSQHGQCGFVLGLD